MARAVVFMVGLRLLSDNVRFLSARVLLAVEPVMIRRTKHRRTLSDKLRPTEKFSRENTDFFWHNLVKYE
jgi:hypothetical protein